MTPFTTHVTLAAGRLRLLPEILQHTVHPTLVDGKREPLHGLDALFEPATLVFVDGCRHDDILRQLARCGIIQIRSGLARYILKYLHPRQSQKRLIYLLFVDTGASGYKSFVDIHKVGKQPRVATQQYVEHTVALLIEPHVIQLVLVSRYHHPRLHGHLFDKLEVSGLRQQMHGTSRGQRRQIIGFDKQVEVKLKHFVIPRPYGYIHKIARHLVNPAYKLLVGKSVGHHAGQPGLVGLCRQKHRKGGLSVATGSSGLLIVLFKRPRQVIVYHYPHVRLVDAHAESVGSHHDTQFVALPAGLLLVLVLRVKAGMVIVGAYARLQEQFGYLARAAARTHVHHRAARGVAQHPEQLPLLVKVISDYIRQIVACETLGIYVALLEEQLLHYVIDHLRSGRCGQGQHRHVRKMLAQLTYFQIGRTEVIAPLRYAMSLVDHDKTDIHLPELGRKRLRTQLFGRYVKYLYFAETAAVHAQLLLGTAKPRMKICGLYAPLSQVVDLIFHQRYKRSHDNRKPIKQHRRHLKGKRLAAARRQQSEGVAPGEHRLYYIFLKRPEILIAPVLAQYIVRISHLPPAS